MRKFFLLFALFLLFSGCISESDYVKQKSETLLSSSTYDGNNDGVIDIYHYKYAKKQYRDYKIQREIYIYPKVRLTSLTPNNLDISGVADATAAFGSFSSKLKTQLDSCAKKTGISNVKCANIDNCASKCEEASSKCKNLAEKYPEFIGYSILSLDQAITERVSLTNSINNDLFSYQSLPISGKQSLFEGLDSLYYVSTSILNGPLYSHSEVDVCTNSMSYISLFELQSILGPRNLEVTGYNYLTILTLSKDESDGEYADLFVKDEIPIDFDSGSIHTVQKAVIDGKYVEWTPLRSDDEDEILFYTFESDELGATNEWETPKYKVRTLDTTFLQPTFVVFDLILPLTNYHLAVSFSMIIPLLLLILIFNFVMFVYNVLAAKIGKKTFYRGMKNYVGIPNLGWKRDLAFGLVAFAIGIGASFFSTSVPDQTLQLFSLVNYVFEDPGALISIFCTVVGSLFTFTAILAFVKSEALQASYRGILVKEKTAALDEVSELKEKLLLLKSMINDYKKEGFDISEAYNAYVSVPMDKLEKVNSKNINKHASFIDKSLNKIENVISLLKNRRESAEKNWSDWSSSISQEFEKEDELHLSSLTFIPVSLRTWAANKFITEHPGEGVFFEGEVLRKKEMVPTDLVHEAVKAGNILNVLVLKNDKPYITVITKGNKTLMQGLFLKFSSYLKTFLKRSNQKDYRYVMGIGDKVVLALIKRGELESLILCPTEKFKQGYDQWKSIFTRLK
uniref:Uncharacterized protein n=1 Tax=uncultured marine group II/III euryarchaeote KM3_195_B08 TaxID=1457970 RepID=A0A075GWX5_9EURY|nr:hypothetical protein [uncultured marine group II/III euryarchaeote KM3_195_B08]